MNTLRRKSNLYNSAVISGSVILFPSAGRGDVAENCYGVISVKSVMSSILSIGETFTRKIVLRMNEGS